REIGGGFIVLSLRPALEWVIVALVTVEAHRQEQLCCVFDQSAGFTLNLIIAGRWVLQVRPASRQDVVDELVVGLVAGDGFADVLAKGGRSLLPEKLAIDLEKVRPFVRPVLDELRTGDQFVDEGFPLDVAMPAVGEEASYIGWSRE